MHYSNSSSGMFLRKVAIVRGGGDLATGIIYRLWRSGFRVLSLEVERPLAVRRTVSAAQAIFDGRCMIEDMPVRRIACLDEFAGTSGVSVMVDPEGYSIGILKPILLVDAMMAKRNLGTRIDMAPLVVGVGPGFCAGMDVDCVIETKRGHYLGRLIRSGSAIPDTGIPGMEMGYTTERLLRSPSDGFVQPLREIGDHVEPGDLIAFVSGNDLRAQIPGVLRGLIHQSVFVREGMKIGDVDPRNEREHCFSITDKALAIAGGVLEALMAHEQSALAHEVGEERRDACA